MNKICLKKGYTGLVMYKPKNKLNYGSLIRTSHILGVDFFATIGERYKKQPSDTTNATYNIPYFKYDSFEEFRKSKPECPLIGIELMEDAIFEHEFIHPPRAIYILGSEDNGLSNEVLCKCKYVIKLCGKMSMNVAVAGSIVLYNRYIQINKIDL